MQVLSLTVYFEQMRITLWYVRVGEFYEEEEEDDLDNSLFFLFNMKVSKLSKPLDPSIGERDPFKNWR